MRHNLTMAPLRPNPTFLGFAMKHIVARPEWLNDPRVELICSASGCFSTEPERPEKYTRWAFNESGWYDTLELAAADAPPGIVCTPFAFELYPLLFDGGRVIETTAEVLLACTTHPLPAGPDPSFTFIGYDVISVSPAASAANGFAPTMGGFDCSPLSCNDCSKDFAVNRYCLIDNWAEACRAAAAFARDGPEPGPYIILGVHWRL